MRSLPPSSEDESSDEEMMAFETNLPFCLDGPSSADVFLPLDFFLAPFPSPPRPFFSRLRPRSSPPDAFLRDLASVFRFLEGGPDPSSPLPLPGRPSDPSVTKPSSSFFLRP